MPDYRLYCLDGAGKISFADWIVAEDDAEAMAKAREMKLNASKCEIWLQQRLVATLGAADLSA